MQTDQQRHNYDSRPATFYGAGYEYNRDHVRLTKQLQKIYDIMKDESWHTLAEISEDTAIPEASVSAALRNLRNPKNGGYYIERVHVRQGLHKYRLQHGRPTNWEPKRRHKDPAGDAEKYREAIVRAKGQLEMTGYGAEHKPLMDILTKALAD